MTATPPSKNFGDRKAIIELKGLSLHYGAGDVVREADLKIYEGETKIILGPSGVGKSTILKAILGLLKPKDGKVFISGEDITYYKESQLVRIRRQMAMVFQHGALFDAMSVGENVSFRLREFQMAPPAEIERKVLEVLNFVGLHGAKKMKPSQLSGGMKKRVAIARALAPDPDIFLFDEPTVGLDPVNHYNIEQLILKLKQKSKRTIVMVTHDVESAYRLADSIVMLHGGKFIFEGTPAELRASKDERIRAFLDPARHFQKPY